MNRMFSIAMIRPGAQKAVSYIAACALVLAAASARVSADDTSGWVATWAASDMPAGNNSRKIAVLEDFTIRQVVSSSKGGNSLRLRISNVFGDKPLIIGAATVAVHGEGSTVVADTITTVTFAGSGTARVPAGEFIYSDAIALRTEDFSELAVSLHFPQALPAITRHGGAAGTTYVSAPGNSVMSESFNPVYKTDAVLFLTGIEVRGPEDVPLIVCFGDSITEGRGADPHEDWPTQLAQRLPGEAAVIRQSITGNRLLQDFAGPGGLNRFGRDVLSWENLDYVIVALGINDLGYPALDASLLPAGARASELEAEDLIEGYRQLIAQAHAKGVRIIGATLTPFKGANYFSEHGEATRVAVNQWIRESNEFDAVIDFDLVLRDGSDPSRFGAQFHNEGDWLHPNAEGYKAIAESIDLAIFWR